MNLEHALTTDRHRGSLKNKKSNPPTGRQVSKIKMTY